MSAKELKSFMRRLILILMLLIVLSGSAYGVDNYDSQHTLLALNTAIVSIHKIVATQDRLVLDQEYSRIINKLALGNIESDLELTKLYSELMNFIMGKGLRHDEARKVQEYYKKLEQQQLRNSIAEVNVSGNDIFSWLKSLMASCATAYFKYQGARRELAEGFDKELWQLRREEIQHLNDLQVRLLTTSWRLVRRYELPDKYRLTQDDLDEFFKAINAPDPERRLRMLRSYNVESKFQVYPPYNDLKKEFEKEFEKEVKGRRVRQRQK